MNNFPDPLKAIVREKLDIFIEAPPSTDFQRGYLMALVELDKGRHPDAKLLRDMVFPPVHRLLDDDIDFGKSCQEVLDELDDDEIRWREENADSQD